MKAPTNFMLRWLFFWPLFSECYGILILLLNLCGFLFLLFLIENDLGSDLLINSKTPHPKKKVEAV